MHQRAASTPISLAMRHIGKKLDVIPAIIGASRFRDANAVAWLQGVQPNTGYAGLGKFRHSSDMPVIRRFLGIAIAIL